MRKLALVSTAQFLHKLNRTTNLKAAFGEFHPDVATVLNNMGSMYFAQNKLAEAEQSYRRALEINEKTVGLAHPELVAPLKEYVLLLRKMKKEKEAEALEARAKAVSGAKSPASEKR